MTTDLHFLFNECIDRHYGLENKNQKSRIPALFHMRKMDGRYTDEVYWELYGLPQRRSPLEPVAHGEMRPSFTKRYTPISYGLMDAIAFEDWKDDKHAFLRRLLPAKGGAMARTFNTLKEVTAGNFFINAFASGTVIGSPTGKGLINTAIPISAGNAGVTYANRFTTEVDLSIASAQAMISLLENQLEANNLEYRGQQVEWVLVNPTQKFIAKQIFNYGERERGTADHNRNYVADEDVKVIVSPYFKKSGTVGATLSPQAYNAWIMATGDHSMNFFTREDFSMDTDSDYTVQAYLFVGTARHIFGFGDHRGVGGSTGL